MPYEDPSTAKPLSEDVAWMRAAAWKARHRSHCETAGLGLAEIVFYGDSITQSLVDSAAWKEISTRHKAVAFGISGDRTPHLLWRIENGEVGKLKPRLAFVLIGTNNIGHLDQSPEDVARGILAIAAALRKRMPATTLVIHGIFPAGELPSDPIRARIKAVNSLVANVDDGHKTKFLDLSQSFLTREGVIPSTLMPDFLHPSEAGYAIWMKQLKPLF